MACLLSAELSFRLPLLLSHRINEDVIFVVKGTVVCLLWVVSLSLKESSLLYRD